MCTIIQVFECCYLHKLLLCNQRARLGSATIRTTNKNCLFSRMWWTITGNFGNILPIDWSKSYARKLHMPALNLNEKVSLNLFRTGNMWFLCVTLCRPLLVKIIRFVLAQLHISGTKIFGTSCRCVYETAPSFLLPVIFII